MTEFFYLDNKYRRQDERLHDPDNVKHSTFLVSVITKTMKNRKLDRVLIDKFFKRK